MDNDKLNMFVDKLRKEKKVSFILYNALYKIEYIDKRYIINQLGVGISYIYDNITTLFDSYLVYGSTLREAFKDINIL